MGKLTYFIVNKGKLEKVEIETKYNLSVIKNKTVNNEEQQLDAQIADTSSVSQNRAIKLVLRIYCLVFICFYFKHYESTVFNCLYNIIFLK